jgi:glucokinase
VAATAERVIGVDLGGTKILAGVVDRAGAIGETRELETPVRSQDALLEALGDVVDSLLDDGIAAVGFGVPSQIDQRTGRTGQAVNIPLGNVPFRDLFAQRFGRPIALDNDANAAAYAEFVAGAGRGSETMVMLTLGTGVGGGIVLDRKLYRGWAEVGHIVVEYDGPPCQGSCTGRGHLESFCSGHAADELARGLFGPIATAVDLCAAARDGDRRAADAVDGLARRLGAGIGSLVNLFDPQVVVLGGGFGIAAFDLLGPPAQEIVRREGLAPAGAAVRIVPATLGPEAGLVGAGLIAFDAVE